jgi:DNA-binding PadR family transcriptional regulator
MKKIQYGFSARYVDIDIARILEENPNSDFIRVEWKRKRHQNSAVYLITEKGMSRLRSVRMSIGYDIHIKHNKRLSIDPDGSLTTFNISNTDSDFHFMEITKEEFEDFYSKLREREERKWPVAVTAIY